VENQEHWFVPGGQEVPAVADVGFYEDFDDAVWLSLRRYVEQVIAALGLSGESFYVQAEPPASAYLAVDGRLPGFPDDDVALLWSETSGWSVAVEAGDGLQVLVLHHLRGGTRPSPHAVARWLGELLRTGEQEVHAIPLVGDSASGQLDDHVALPRSA
jgi:hypothetical protein